MKHRKGPGIVHRYQVVKSFGDDLFNAAATTDNADVWTQPAGSILLVARATLLLAFAAPSLVSVALTLGDAGDPDGLEAAAADLVADPLGTKYQTRGAYFDATAGSLLQAAAKTWKAYATAVGANFADLTAGSVVFEFVTLEP